MSLVLNDSPLVAAKTRDRVRQAMTGARVRLQPRCGFAPHPAQRRHRRGADQHHQPVLRRIRRGASGHPDQQRHRPPAGGQRRGPRHCSIASSRSLVERAVDGIVLVPAHGTKPEDLPDLLGTPLVLLARRRARHGCRLRGRAKPRRRAMRPPSISSATAAATSPLSVVTPTPQLARSARAAWRNS